MEAYRVIMQYNPKLRSSFFKAVSIRASSRGVGPRLRDEQRRCWGSWAGEPLMEEPSYR